MRDGKKVTVVAAATVVFAGVGGSSGGTADVGPDDDLARAVQVALGVTGGGRVTGTEVGDEESRYEIEVTLPDGGQVDVQLDESFAVVGRAPDVEEPPGS
jgi:hypothetical protein